MNQLIGIVFMMFSMQLSELSMFLGTQAGLAPNLAGTSWFTIWLCGFTFMFYRFNR
jgi:hypothetical protein